MVGDPLVKFAKYVDEIAGSYPFEVFFSCPHPQIQQIASLTKNIIITAQSMDVNEFGNEMGKILIDSLIYSGAKAVILNHASASMSLKELIKASELCKERGIKTIFCAGELMEIEMISLLKPEVIVCEQETNIGTGISSSREYMKLAQKTIFENSPFTRIIQGGGITNSDDIDKAITSGADGVGMTSSIMLDKDPYKKTIELMDSLLRCSYGEN